MIREQPDPKVEIARVCENQASVSESFGLRGWQPIDGMTAAWNMQLDISVGGVASTNCLIKMKVVFSYGLNAPIPGSQMIANEEFGE